MRKRGKSPGDFYLVMAGLVALGLDPGAIPIVEAPCQLDRDRRDEAGDDESAAMSLPLLLECGQGVGNDGEKYFGADDRFRAVSRISMSTCERQGGREKRRKSHLPSVSAQGACRHILERDGLPASQAAGPRGRGRSA